MKKKPNIETLEGKLAMAEALLDLYPPTEEERAAMIKALIDMPVPHFVGGSSMIDEGELVDRSTPVQNVPKLVKK